MIRDSAANSITVRWLQEWQNSEKRIAIFFFHIQTNTKCHVFAPHCILRLFIYYKIVHEVGLQKHKVMQINEN